MFGFDAVGMTTTTSTSRFAFSSDGGVVLRTSPSFTSSNFPRASFSEVDGGRTREPAAGYRHAGVAGMRAIRGIDLAGGNAGLVTRLQVTESR